MSDKGQHSASVVKLAARREPMAASTMCVGRLVAWSREQGALVEVAGRAEGPVAARSMVPFDAQSAARTIESEQELVLSFEDGDPARPIVLGLLEPRAEVAVEDADAGGVQVHADGQRVTVEGKERVELRCGKASIVLTKAGKILLRGTYVSSHSTGAQRLRGGSIEVN